jgi:hypothetical protein
VEARRLFLGFPFEMRQMFQELVRRPEDIPKAIEDMMKLAQAKKK